MLRGMVRIIGACALSVVGLVSVAPTSATAQPVTAPGPRPRVEAPAPPAAARGVGILDPRKSWGEAVAAAGAPAAPSAPSPSAPMLVLPSAQLSAAVAATLSVTPDTNLERGQSVAVTGTGLGTERVYVLECIAGEILSYNCNSRSMLGVVPDAGGAISTAAAMHRKISGPTGPVDCATALGTCELVVASRNGTVLVRHALGFDPNSAPPTSQITVTPETGLTGGQGATVTGTGFFPNDEVYVRECAATDSLCSGGPAAYLQTDGSGAFSTPLKVLLLVDDGHGNTTHCLAVTCILRAQSIGDLEYAADAAIAFDPNQPIPALPHLTVTPATGLTHEQSVVIAGTGFGPSSYIDLSECGASTDQYCNDYLDTGDSLRADTNGAFTVTTTLSRLAGTYTPGVGLVIGDCATASCAVQARSFSDGDSTSLSARAAISFDATVAPPPPPVVTVTPHSNLPYRTQVAVHGTGFKPRGYVEAQFCASAIAGRGCGYSFFYGSGQADDSGTVDITLTVKRRVSFRSETSVDCVDSGSECLVQVQGRSFENLQVPVTFDPNAPIPPAPVVVVAPSTNLGWRQVVGVLGTGLTPGPISVQQCGTLVQDQSSYTSCGQYAQATVNADGVVLAGADVRRMLDFGFGPGGQTLDCATSATPCTLQVGNGDPDESATVPLGFDPNSQAPPPPVLTMTPSTHLIDGQAVTVHGSGFTPGATIGMAPCKSGVTAIADDCDLGRAFSAVADDTGAFTTSQAAAGVLGTARGLVECTTAPGTCVLAAANASDLSEFSTTPFSADPVELMLRSVSVVEGTGGMTEAEVMVEISAPIGSPTTVAWHASPGTATEDDYMSRSGRAVIPAGATSTMIHARIEPDAVAEPTEAFTITADTAPGTTIVEPTATITIRDDDGASQVSIEDGRGREARGRSHSAVTLSAPSRKTVTVDFTTHHGTARSGKDYVRTKDRVVFLPGETRHVVHIALVNDTKHEPDETFTIELHDAKNATIDRAIGTVTIRDDD